MSVDNLWICRIPVDSGIAEPHDADTEVNDVPTNGRNELLARAGRKVRAGAEEAEGGVREAVAAVLFGVPDIVRSP
jgi:hypothetical protein